jgi:sporulation protein YlmC with PRC-barrel domain
LYFINNHHLIDSCAYPAAVGFCGTTSSSGKLSNIVNFFSPIKITKSVLSQGNLARKVDIRIREGMSHQLREMAIKLLSLDRRIDSYFDITNHYQSYYFKSDSNRIVLENLFVENMNKCDYVLCLRGTGNYSGRFYMALNAGRIPVVVDTDIVIPFEDHLHIVKIPVDSIKKIGDFILEHFEKTTEQELREMKIKNRAVYNQLLVPEKFLPNFLNGVVKST